MSVQAIHDTVKQRLIEAEIVDRIRPGGRTGPAKLKAWWPEMAARDISIGELIEALHVPLEERVRLRPADISRAEEAMLWYSHISDDLRFWVKLVTAAYAHPKPKFMATSRAFNVSKQTLRNRYNKGVDELVVSLCKRKVLLLPVRSEIICPFAKF